MGFEIFPPRSGKAWWRVLGKRRAAGGDRWTRSGMWGGAGGGVHLGVLSGLLQLMLKRKG